MYTALCSALPLPVPRVPSTYTSPWRSDTSPSQPGRMVTDGTSATGFWPKIVGPMSTVPRTFQRTGPR